MTRIKEVMQILLDAAEQAREAMVGAIDFGVARVVCVGPDAEIRQSCAAMLEGASFGYEAMVERSTDRAEAIAPLRAATAEGRREKAAVVHKLNQASLACYAGRILATPLVLGMLGYER